MAIKASDSITLIRVDDGEDGKTLYGVCSTAAATAAKVVNGVTGFSLYTGVNVSVKFAITNTASNPTLNINGTGAKPIYYRGSVISAGYLAANRTYIFCYNGTQWEFAGDINTDTYDLVKFSGNVKASAAIVAGNIIVGNSAGYHHLKTGGSFDISYPILYAASAIASGSAGNNNYTEINLTIATTQSITLTAYKTVFIKGTLAGSVLTPVSTAPLTQAVPTTQDNYYYISLGIANTSTTLRLSSEHPIYRFIGGKFAQMGATADQTILSWCKDNNLIYIDGSKLYADSVTADKIKVNSLSALAANLGNITGGSMNINNKFIVDESGNITAVSGKIAGMTVGIDSLSYRRTGDIGGVKNCVLDVVFPSVSNTANIMEWSIDAGTQADSSYGYITPWKMFSQNMECAEFDTSEIRCDKIYCSDKEQPVFELVGTVNVEI